MSSADTSLPFEAYRGEEPYIFISYSHKDSERVFADILRLNRQGYRIWYDEGIAPGNEWPEEIAKALSDATVFLVFISPNAIQSQNVRNEINFALNRQKFFVAVYLEETQLPQGLELRMGDIQAIMKWKVKDTYFNQKIVNAIPTEVRESKSEDVVNSAYKIEWTALLRGAQYNPIRAMILPLGREILCVNSGSSDTWVYAIRSNGGGLLWQVSRNDSKQHLKMIGWDSDYLYLTGEIEVEQDFCFAKKIWLREGDESAAIVWYETKDHSYQKYDAIPEWDSVQWTPVSQLESANIASTTELKASIVDGVLHVKDLQTHKVTTWTPAGGDTITSVAFYLRKPIVALSSGHVCMLQE